MDTALRTLIGVVRGPSMMIAGLAAATAVAGALAYVVSTIRSAGAAEARLDELARISVENGELADAQRAAAADARASEAGIRERLEASERRLRVAARTAGPARVCGLNDSIREAIDAWRAQ